MRSGDRLRCRGPAHAAGSPRIHGAARCAAQSDRDAGPGGADRAARAAPAGRSGEAEEAALRRGSMKLVGRLKKLETAAEANQRVMAAGIVWTTDHERYAGELQPETRIVSDIHVGEDYGGAQAWT